MTKHVHTKLLEFSMALEQISRVSSTICVQSDVAANVLTDLLNKTTSLTTRDGMSKLQFILCNELGSLFNLNKNLFCTEKNFVVTDNHVITKLLTNNFKSRGCMIFLGTANFWKELRDKNDVVLELEELSSEIPLSDLYNMLLKTGLFTDRKADSVVLYVKNKLSKRTINLSDLLKIINIMQLVSEKDIALFAPTFEQILNQEDSFFLLPRLLFVNPEDFLLLWKKTKDLFPMQFWTVFWVNFFSKLFAFKVDPEFYCNDGQELVKSILKLRSTKNFNSFTQSDAARVVVKLFKIDWSLRNTSNHNQLDSIFLSIITKWSV